MITLLGRLTLVVALCVGSASFAASPAQRKAATKNASTAHASSKKKSVKSSKKVTQKPSKPLSIEEKWEKALQLAQNNELKSAVNLIQEVIDSDQETIGDDLIAMTAGRLFYQLGQLDKAKKFYNEVPKTSDYWLESVEEKAWAEVRRNDYDKALSHMETLMVPLFAPQIGPESYFLKTFVDIKICDYRDLFSTLKLFSKNIKPRAAALESLVENPNSEFVNTVLSKIKTKDIKQEKLGELAQKLPRYFWRDRKLQNHVINGEMPEARKRLASLAEDDLKEIKKNLKKMQIVEVEAIQRMYLAEKSTQSDPKDKPSYDNHTMTFPKSEEVWLDEVDKMQVQTSRCHYPTKGDKNL